MPNNTYSLNKHIGRLAVSGTLIARMQGSLQPPFWLSMQGSLQPLFWLSEESLSSLRLRVSLALSRSLPLTTHRRVSVILLLIFQKYIVVTLSGVLY